MTRAVVPATLPLFAGELGFSRALGHLLSRDLTAAVAALVRLLPGLDLVEVLDVVLEEGHSGGRRRSDVVVRGRRADGSVVVVRIEVKVRHGLSSEQARDEALAADHLLVVGLQREHLVVPVATTATATFADVAAALTAGTTDPWVLSLAAELVHSADAARNPLVDARALLAACVQELGASHAAPLPQVELEGENTARAQTAVLRAGTPGGWGRAAAYAEVAVYEQAQGRLVVQSRVLVSYPLTGGAAVAGYPVRLAAVWDRPAVRRAVAAARGRVMSTSGAALVDDPDRRRLSASRGPAQLVGYRMASAAEPYAAYGVGREVPAEREPVLGLLQDSLSILAALTGRTSAGPAGAVAREVPGSAGTGAGSVAA